MEHIESASKMVKGIVFQSPAAVALRVSMNDEVVTSTEKRLHLA